MIGGVNGCLVVVHGFRELQSGRWTGVIWVMIGTGIAYMSNRERIEVQKQKRAEKNQRREVSK